MVQKGAHSWIGQTKSKRPSGINLNGRKPLDRDDIVLEMMVTKKRRNL